MKYSIQYYKGCEILKEADEIIIKSTKSDLIDMCGKWPNKSIVADITSFQDYTSFLDGFPAPSNLSLLVSTAQLKYLFADLKELNIKFIISETCSSWDSLIYQLEYNPSQIRVGGELGFDLHRVKNICGKTKIRCYPNVAQFCGLESPQDTFRNFFISPSIVSIYEDYVDILEFYGDDLRKQEILYKIYRDEKWNDDLSPLILGLNLHINDTTIPPYIWSKRLSCGKVCYKQGTCHSCEEAVNFSKTFSDKGYALNLGELNE